MWMLHLQLLLPRNNLSTAAAHNEANQFNFANVGVSTGNNNAIPVEIVN